ncbi:MAG: SHOCT domain-containing protein [Mycoplasmataceae bacterium]|nr:SHOCT domain-containing protein [Mycoplasmataceae bacterium]
MGRFKGVHITSLSAGITFMGLVIILFCVSAERGAWHGDLPMFVTLFIILMNISVTLIILGSIGIHRTKNSKSAHSLEKYFDLYKKKIISKEEFEAKKKQYLS